MLITPDKFEKAIKFLEEIELLAIDTETYKTTTSWQNRILIGVSTYGKLLNGQTANFYFPFRHGNSDNIPCSYLSKLADGLNSAHTLLFHNAKFDLNILRRDGIILNQPFYCTMIMSHLLNVNGTHALKDLCKLYRIDRKADDEKLRMGVAEKQYGRWDQIPAVLMEPYACKDTRLTYQLYFKLRSWLEQADLMKLWAGEEAYCRALADMEYHGMLLDQDMAEKLDDQTYYRIKEIIGDLGFDPGKPALLANKLFKELKFKEVRESPKKKYTPTKQFPDGRPDMDEHILLRYKHPVVDRVLEYRGLVKARSTWYKGLVDYCDDESRIHTHFNQIGTVTTRLTSSKPNVQQFPRDEEEAPVKKMFHAPPGYVLVEFDYSQIEYRLAAVYANETKVLEAYGSGADFHDVTAKMLGIGRQDGKTANFLLLFLGGPQRLAEVFGLAFSEAKEFKARYHRIYPRLLSKAHEVNAKAESQGYIHLWSGHRTEFQIQYETKKAWNRVIQGGAGQIIRQGIINAHVSGNRSRLISMVHDSVWVEIPVAYYDSEVERIKYALEWPSRDPRFKIPFIVDMKVLAEAR